MAYKNPEGAREYRQGHKKESREYDKKYRQEHKEDLKKQDKERRQKSRDKDQKGYRLRQKARKLKSQYNLTLETLDAILIQQNHKCAICGKHLTETQRCIDHDHVTGCIRGILCIKCNCGLGYFQYFWDNLELLKIVLCYLRGSTQTNVK